MRVLHLVKTLEGAAWACRQVEVLRRCGVEIVVASPYGCGRMLGQYEACGVSVIQAPVCLPHRAPWRLPLVLSAVRRLVDQVEPDLIHSHFVTTTLCVRMALGSRHPVPRLFQVPGPLHLENAVVRQLDLHSVGPQDYVVGSCRWTCQQYLRLKVPPERVALSYYGTDVDTYLAASARGPSGPVAVSGHPLIGMVAWMYPPKYVLGQTRGIKGHEDFLRALPQVFARYPDARALIVGKQWGKGRGYELRLRRLARSLCGDRVVFLGHRDDVAGLYSLLDLAVHPSLSDNVGGAVESLLAGCPTVGAEVGGIPDLVRHGETGWLIPPGRPDLLAEAMFEALGDEKEARRRAAQGQLLARVMFDVNRTAAEIAELYERILQRSSGS